MVTQNARPSTVRWKRRRTPNLGGLTTPENAGERPTWGGPENRKRAGDAQEALAASNWEICLSAHLRTNQVTDHSN